jgi:MFS family permease
VRPALDRPRSFAAVAYAFAVTMLGTTLPTPLYALYSARFGFSELVITVIFATYAIGVIAALLLFGSASDAIGRRRALMPGLVCSGLAAVAFLLANGLPLLLVGRLLSGCSAGIFTGAATATLLDLAPEGRGERATLIATVVNMGGLGLGPLLAGALVQWLTLRLRLSYWVDLALLVPAAAGIVFMCDPGGQSGGGWRPQGLRVPADLRATFTRAALAGFAGFAVLGLFTAVSPAFLAKILHQPSHLLLGVVVFAVFLASTAGQAALARIGTATALSGGCAGLIAAMALLALGLAASSLAVLVAGGVLAGFAQGLSFRAGLATLGEQAPPEHRGEVASSFFVVAYVALSIPVLGEGVLAELAGLRTAGLVFTGAVGVLAAIVLGLLSRG